MGGLRKDFIERLIEQLAQVLARLLRVRAAQGEEAVRDALGDACRELLGMEYRVLVAADARAAAVLLGEPVRVEALAALVEQEALSWAATDAARAARVAALEARLAAT